METCGWCRKQFPHSQMTEVRLVINAPTEPGYERNLLDKTVHWCRRCEMDNASGLIHKMMLQQAREAGYGE